MKKSLLALAVLGTFAGVASAQSSVKLDGTVDLGLQTVKNGSAAGGSQQKSMINNGINSSQFRVSGVEDLGGGLKAGFNLNSGVFADTGRSSSENGGKFWNRRATMSLMGGFGELRLGRDYTPTFWNQTLYDPFGTNGVGSYLGVFGQSNLGTNATTGVRADNSIQYWTPALGGFEAQVMVSANENAAAASGNKYTGIRVNFAAGPFSIGASTGSTTVAPASQADDKLKVSNFAASYKVGPAKLNVQLGQSKNGNVKEKATQLGASVALGQGALNFAYNRIDHSGGVGQIADSADANHVAIGYTYNLSTRTAFYGTYASAKNKGASRYTVGGLTSTGMLNDEKSNGLEVGLRHFF